MVAVNPAGSKVVAVRANNQAGGLGNALQRLQARGWFRRCGHRETKVGRRFRLGLSTGA